MDFNGCVLGFFRDGDDSDSGTLFAFHAVSETDGFWISTGINVPLDAEGAARNWIRLDVAQNLLRKTSDLSVNGNPALAWINHAAPASPDTFELWLYGHERGTNRFDDKKRQQRHRRHQTRKPDHVHRRWRVSPALTLFLRETSSRSH